MTADFTYYFRSMVAALGERPGWYGLYAQRDPAAARDHESGREIPPWDVVRTVLRDLAANSGAADVDPGEAGRAYALHRAALAAEDAEPGAEARLHTRLAIATRARESAVTRAREAARAYAHHPTAAHAQSLTWTRDDLTRTTTRCTDLHQRLAAVAPSAPDPPDPGRLDTHAPAARPAGFAGAPQAPAGRRPAEADGPAARAPRGARFAAAPRSAQADGPAAWAPQPPAPDASAVRAVGDARFAAPPEPPAPDAAAVRAPRGARFAAPPRGARFAGAPDAAPAQESAPQAEAAGPAVSAASAARAPRGARFAGVYEQGVGDPAGIPDAASAQGVASRPQAGAARAPRGARFAGAPQAAAVVEAVRPVVDARWVAEARAEAARLGYLRQTGESGAAYLVLCAAAEGPAERLPYVVRELERTGLAADVATLLWEIAALPPQPVAEAVSALAAAGRGPQSRTLLHQVAARPAGDVAVVADLLHGGGRTAEAGELLETVARGRPAAAAAAVARARPALTDPLLAAAARVSPPCHRDLAAALHGGDGRP